MGITTKLVSDIEERLARARETGRALEAQRRAALQELRQSIRDLRHLGDAGPTPRSEGVDPGKPVQENGRPRDDGALGLCGRFDLSVRELEVALLLSQGLSNREIAAMVRVSTHTARHHTQHVLGKLGVRSRARAAALINNFLVHG